MKEVTYDALEEYRHLSGKRLNLGLTGIIVLMIIIITKAIHLIL